MPIITSAKKRVRVSTKAAIRNSKTKRTLKAAVKLFRKQPSSAGLSAAQSNLDIAAKKGVIHKNKAARLKKQAAATAKAAGVSPTASKKTAPAPTVAKKPAAKKPAAKKAAPKAAKPATKK